MTNRQNNSTPTQKDSLGGDVFNFGEKLKGFFDRLIDLDKGIDKYGTIENIRENKRMEGSNAWLLMCSIMVASLGLDLNSPAVIIGAMLISPLMSPILGIGMAVGINDREMLIIAIKHFGISIAIALVTSFLYFKLTPIGEATPEIMNRTAPTILDVLVAFFGGIAGIVSGSRKDKSNAIPGVAIATALMPPLCVTGFGLATGDWDIMMKSFYLFFLNAVFVAMATYLMVRFMQFPYKEFVNAREKRRTQLIILVFSLILIIPSVIILSGVLEKLQDRRKIETFVGENFKNSIVRFSENTKDDTLNVQLFLFDEISDDSISMYRSRFHQLHCRAKLRIIRSQDKDFIKADFANLEQFVKGEMLTFVETNRVIQKEKDRQINDLQKEVDSLKTGGVVIKELEADAKKIFPNLGVLEHAEVSMIRADSVEVNLHSFKIQWSSKKSKRIRREETARLFDFIKLQTKLDTFLIEPLE